nr:unnamed protein product [Digitaria exilis]
MARSNTSCLHLIIVLLLLLGCERIVSGSGPAAASGDRETLLAIKTDWGSPPGLSSWGGVTCAAAAGVGIVTELYLQSLNLTGSVPASDLKLLNLSDNNLSGAFPAAALYACRHLSYLDLSYNGFTGPELAGLELLTLSGNAFAPGPVPPKFAKTKLTILTMDEMFLTGEIPEAFGNLTELTVLSMSWNELTGSIPAWVWHHRKLEYADLSYNCLSGELTRNITAIDLSTNQLTGEIPPGFGNLKNLKKMYLYNNQLTGPIPASIGMLPRLYDLWVSGNQLSGELPQELGKHSPLGIITVYDNNISGPLPKTLCANGELHYIAASNNIFSGELPANLGDCIRLSTLMLDYNHFSGVFPAKIWSRTPQDEDGDDPEQQLHWHFAGRDIFQHLRNPYGEQHVLWIHPDVCDRAGGVQSGQQQVQWLIAGRHEQAFQS